MGEPIPVRYFEIGPERTTEFVAKGYKGRHVFPHQFYYLPKCGPDGLQLARRMCGPCDLEDMLEIVLYAHSSELAGIPENIFFDDDLCWHQQQFGKTGQIATINLLRCGADLFTMVHQSDLVQRASRAGQYRTRIQNRFKGWNFMLLNAVLNFAIEQNIRSVYTPTAEMALRNTDPKRNVGPDLFDRIYDRQLQQVLKVSRARNWWHIDVQQNRDVVIRAAAKLESLSNEKVICVCHDTERGENLTEVLRIQRQVGIRATYNVVGRLVPDVREQIESEGHCLAFHSFNHPGNDGENQLAPCRSIDYRLKGYRPPRSNITRELSEENLCLYNFEWLASSTDSLGFKTPRMQKGLVKIPIEFDDSELHSGQMSWNVWEQHALETIGKSDFIAFSLHDCHASAWLPNYAPFLEKVRKLGTLKSMNDVLNVVVMSHAR